MAESTEELVPELGDWITILSDTYKTTSGRIIYRDGSLIRIRPTQSSHTGVDFPLDPTTGLFQEALGVQEVLIHEKRKHPQFSIQLSVVPGEILEFFSVEGTPAGEGIVAKVVATDAEDGIILEDGKILNFEFIGSTSPYDILRPRAAPENVAPPENNTNSDAEAVEPSEEVFPEIDYDLLPAALVEEIPSEEQTFSDSAQREDMFVSLLVDVPLKKQRDPKIMQSLYRTTDLLLAMKNSLVVRDESGAILPTAQSISYVVDSLQDILEKSRNGDSLRAFLPIIAVKKVLYTDDAEPFHTDDTESRSDVGTLINVAGSGTQFQEQTVDNAFVSYIHSVLQTIQAYVPATASNERIAYDMDVLRSQVPPKPVIGFLSTPPAVDKVNDGIPLYSDSLSTIKNRLVRLLSSSFVRNPKTGAITVVAPADSGKVLEYILLSSNMLRFRTPIRSSVLLWDIGASETSRSNRSLFYNTLMKNWDSQDIYNPEMVLPLADFLSDRLPMATAFTDEYLTAVLDSFGLRNLEISTPAFAPVLDVVEAGIAKWNNQYATLRAASLAAATAKEVPAVAPLVGTESALFGQVVSESPFFKTIADHLNENVSLLKNYDLMLVDGLIKIANKTLGPYYYAVAGGGDPAVTTALQNTYNAEARRIDRNTATVRELVSAFQSTPDINPCPHVKELERVMNIRADEKRMVLLEETLNRYQAGQRGNFALCGNCGEDLICKHEILMLNEFLHPGRKQALHKSLLLEYAGPVFEGAYICKACGQKIQELEYDSHLEFDDEGRPLIGRGVVSENEDEETTPNVVLREEVKEGLPFTTESDIKIYFVARTLFEQCGYVATNETYKRVVSGTQDFLKLRVPDRDNYEKLLAASAKASKRSASPPSYDTFFANYQIGVLGGFVLLEIQTSSVNVPFPPAGCTFTRSGFPLDGDDPSVAGNGALMYVACVMANIFRNDAPWNLTSWSAETQMPKRIKATENAIRLAVTSILCIVTGKTTPAPLTNVTDTYKDMLKAKKESETTEIVKDSERDVLPPSFRPMPVISEETIFKQTSIQNVKKYQTDVSTLPVSVVGPFVRERNNQLNTQLMQQFYKESAASGVVVENSPRSDSVCCFSPLGDVSRIGLGVQSLHVENLQAEMIVQEQASISVERRDSSKPNAGSHIYVPWSAVTNLAVLPELDSSAYYKIFLQYCYRGIRHGAVHEFNAGGVCRWCRFTLPAELLTMTTADITESGGRRQVALDRLTAKKEELSLEALRRQNIMFDESAFQVLEKAMKNQKGISPMTPLVVDDFMTILVSLNTTLNRLVPSATDDWRIFMTAMKRIAEKGVIDIERRYELAEFSRVYDSVLKNLLRQMTTGLGLKGCDKLLKRVGKRFGIDMSYRGTEATLTATNDLLVKLFDAISNNMDSTVVLRNYLDIFVKLGAQIRYEFTVDKPNVNKWFPKISRSHKTLLNTIWEKSFNVVSGSVHNLKEYSDETIDILQASLDRYSTWFGTWLAVMQTDIRAGVQVTPQEFRLMAQWSLFIGLTTLFNESSPFYADATDSIKKVEATKFHIGWVCEALISATDNIQKYQKTQKEITEAIEARAELEKAFFIKKLDDLDKDLRGIELRKKALKIGDWSVGTLKNLFSYDADFFDFQRGQRSAMGVPEFASSITGQMETEPMTAAIQEEGYDHRAPADEDMD